MSKAFASLKKLAALTQGINAYSDEGSAKKAVLHSAGKSFLRVLAADLGLDKGDFDVRGNLGGMAVSGEVTLHGESLYVQLSEGFRGDGVVTVMYRTCKGRKDYAGDRNHFTSMNRLAGDGHGGYDSFVAACKRLIEDGTAKA